MRTSKAIFCVSFSVLVGLMETRNTPSLLHYPFPLSTFSIVAAEPSDYRAFEKKEPSKLKKASNCVALLLLVSALYDGFGRAGVYSSVLHLRNSIQNSIGSGEWNGKPRLHFGTLSYFWAQEYIGADLAKNLMRNDHVNTVKVGILDGGFYFDESDFRGRWAESGSQNTGFSDERDLASHGTAVTNLILGNGPFSVSENARIGRIINGDVSTRSFFDDPNIRLINVSMGKTTTERQSELNDRRLVDEQEKIIVYASGNKRSQPFSGPLGMIIDGLDEYFSLRPDRQRYGISVGSLDPWGRVSSFSNPGPNVIVVAPSDTRIRTRTIGTEWGDYQDREFGGTSGAAPLVTGTLANVMGYIPSLTLQEAEILLKKTALQLKEHDNVNHGVGMVNTIRAVEIARRLRALNFESLSSAERLDALNDSASYNFEQRANDLELRAAVFLNRRPEERPKGLDLLRHAFLLSPTLKRGEKLAAEYTAVGLTSNAQFFVNVLPD